jgi:hypothetical protein
LVVKRFVDAFLFVGVEKLLDLWSTTCFEQKGLKIESKYNDLLNVLNKPECSSLAGHSSPVLMFIRERAYPRGELLSG